MLFNRFICCSGNLYVQECSMMFKVGLYDVQEFHMLFIGLYDVQKGYYVVHWDYLKKLEVCC